MVRERPRRKKDGEGIEPRRARVEGVLKTLNDQQDGNWAGYLELGT